MTFWLANARVGDELPSSDFGNITLSQLVQWSSAVDDYTPIHFDRNEAESRGLPGVTVHGPFKAALLVNMLRSSMTDEDKLMDLRCEYRRVDVVGEAIRGQGVVTARTPVADGHLLSIDLWIEKSNQEKSVLANATVKVGIQSNLVKQMDSAADGPELLDDQIPGSFTVRLPSFIVSEVDSIAEESAVNRPSRAEETCSDGHKHQPKYSPVELMCAIEPILRRSSAASIPLRARPSLDGKLMSSEIECVREMELEEVLTVVQDTESSSNSRSVPNPDWILSTWSLHDQQGLKMGRIRLKYNIG